MNILIGAMALLLSTFVGDFIIAHVIKLFIQDGEGKAHARASAVGRIERFIYTSCILVGLPVEIIGGWLVLKGLAQFRPKGDEKAATPDFLTDYYGYLIGTGLSLIVGIGFGLLGRYWMGIPLVIPKA